MRRRGKVSFRQRYRDSRRIAATTLRLIGRERDLWVLPLTAGLLLISIFALGALGALQGWIPRPDGTVLGVLRMSAVVFLAGLPIMVAATSTQAAFVYALYQRLEGRPVTVRTALARASRHLGTIIVYNVVGATIGGIIAVVGQSLEALRIIPGLGRVANLVGGLAWAAAAFFVIPVIVIERERRVFGALRRSVAIGRQQWGKTVAGVITLALVALVPYLIIAGAGILIMTIGLVSSTPALMFAGIAVVLGAIVVFLLLMPVMQAIQVAYQTVLYRFAVTGRISEPFGVETVVGVWEPYRR